MQEFYYLVEKIEKADTNRFPFNHIYIEDFLSEQHFKLFVESSFINLPPANNTRYLVSLLLSSNYKNIKFPGCSTDIEAYINNYEENFSKIKQQIVESESYGLAFKLTRRNVEELRPLIEFLNCEVFHDCLRKKFSLVEETIIKTGVQKYLSGYSISPHPDNRGKALTYLININPFKDSEQLDIHTHLLSFKPERDYIRKFWEDNPDKERGWLPWDWCESKKVINKNNSLIMFSPDNDTLHAVKLNYDHCVFQRTQLYGNLWYKNQKKYDSISYINIPSI